LKGLRQLERIPLQFYELKQLFTDFVQQAPQGGNKKVEKEKKQYLCTYYTIINLDLDDTGSKPNF
jgi:hypothetical protein